MVYAMDDYYTEDKTRSRLSYCPWAEWYPRRLKKRLGGHVNRVQPILICRPNLS